MSLMMKVIQHEEVEPEGNVSAHLIITNLV